MTIAYSAAPADVRSDYRHALCTDSLIYTRIQLLTLSHSLVTSITPEWIDGQVNVNNTDGPNKVLSIGFRDPANTLRFDSSAPTQGFNGPDRLIRVTQMVLGGDLTEWVTHDVVTARPTTVERDGELVTVEAQDKACLHLRNVPSFTLNKGANVVNAIRLILSRGGETRFKFPANIKARLPRDTPVGGNEEKRQPWLVARRLARSINMQLYYDGSGYAVLRQLPSNPAWRVIESGSMSAEITPNTLKPVKSNVDLSRLRNKVVVKYHVPKTKRAKAKTLAVSVVAESSHPFSAQSLAVNGTPWWSVEYFDEQDIHTEAAARKFGKARLDEFLRQAVQIQADIVPVFHLDPLDLIRVQTRSATFDTRFQEGSIPLGPSGSAMTVGYQAFARRPAAGIIKR